MIPNPIHKILSYQQSKAKVAIAGLKKIPRKDETTHNDIGILLFDGISILHVSNHFHHHLKRPYTLSQKMKKVYSPLFYTIWEL